ncbi:Cysteine and histidine-rich protein 1 like [Pseudolycoriella hygida]|uniref:Cysteine and histidine-rich protein 1 like n=1 Tax=Pseudolycoriella hygida TaxID=35572 RepID=A0A9Q0MQT6_9DIPT|nr:Cysteine and histidine-rich protein 1 like [Pseudolycoriella hygida]
MADSIVESGSSSVSIQAPTVSGHSMNPLPLIAAEIIQMDTSNPPPRPPLDDSICSEPELKRKKMESAVASTSGINEKLELRLGGILCCAVCLDLPKTAMYQCQMGHLICASCFNHLIADGRLRDQVATCPNCRVEISKSTASRNLAVEKAVSELPSDCQFCGKEFPSKSLERHEQNECEERPTTCKYVRIGCQWKGPLHEATEHEANCSHPKKSGAEVMIALQATDATQSEDKKLFNTLIELLSYEKIIFNDLQMKPYRTDEYVHKLFYETSRFSAFNHQWVVKARINNGQRDPHTVNERQITYQLILKTKTSAPLSIHFFALKGPFSDMKNNTQIYKHDFTDQENESEYFLLPLPDSSECNRLLAAKAINFSMSALWIILLLSFFVNGSYSIESLQDGIQYRLPNDTKPETYDIYISTGVHNQDFTFEGSVTILLSVVLETTSITLHSHRLHNIGVVTLQEEGGSEPIPLANHAFNVNNNFLTIPLLSGVLEREKRYILHIPFNATLQEEPRGFYKSSYIDDNGNVRYLATTQLAMTDARHAFPCYDEAALRANFTIKIRHGSNYHAVSNMPVNGLPEDDGNGFSITTFMTTPLSPTYIIAYTISDFAYKSNENSGSGSIPFRTYARSNAIEGATYSVEVGEKLLTAFNNYFGINFALPKMDQVAVADFPFSAMENWGMVVYREPVLLFFPNSTHALKTRITTLIAHEFAHQWFGNLVTPKWWTYAWLSEGFATLFANLATNWIYPEWEINDYFVFSTLQNVFQTDAADSSRPMSSYVESPAAILDVLDSVTYDKASCVIRMIMHAVTEETLKRGLVNYFTARAYLAADENDLFEGISEAVPESIDITAIMSSWTQQKGYPFLTITRNYNTGSASVRQERYQTYVPAQSDSTLWWIPLTFASASTNDFLNTTAQLWMKKTERSITISNDWKADEWIIFNKQQSGYYRVLYDEENYRLITKELVEGNLTKIHLATRSQLTDDAFNFAKTGRLDYAVVFELLTYLKNEREVVPWSSAFRGLQFIHRMVAASAHYHHLQTFTLGLVNGLFDYIGIKNLPDDEPHFNKELRILATNWACRMGSQKCLEETNKELRENWENINSNMRPTIYCNGLRSNDDSDFVTLRNKLNATFDSNERNIILTALGCSMNSSRLQEYIHSSIENVHLSQAENYRVFTAVLENGQLGLNVVVQFLEENFGQAASAYGASNINNAVIATATNIVSTEMAEKILPVVELAASNNLITNETLTQTTKLLEDNKEWLDNHQEAIDSWLHDFYNSSGSKSAIVSISLTVVLVCLRSIFE